MEQHSTHAVEQTDKHVIFLCPTCGYRVRIGFDGSRKVLNFGAADALHSGSSSPDFTIGNTEIVPHPAYEAPEPPMVA